jgi:Glycolipid transfer protein (GLTP)
MTVHPPSILHSSSSSSSDSLLLKDPNDHLTMCCRCCPCSPPLPTRNSLHDYNDMDDKCDNSDCAVHQRRLSKTEISNHSAWSSHASDSTVEGERSWRPFSLAKLSFVILACATLMDMLLTNMSSTADRPRASLGSAAISSVTDTLSPILPFAGGLDLRRDDYWLVSDDSTWFRTLQSVVQQVQDAFAASKDDAAHTNQHSMNASLHSTLPKSKRPSLTFDMPISTPQPFVSLDTIAQLTLGDIGECFRHAMESSQTDFNMQRFLSATHDSSTQPYLIQVIHAMQDAVRRSRGKAAADWVRPSAATTEVDPSVDALKFAAAMRVFAEWRLLRQVPDGYKGFAIGMSLGHKDVVQNVIKIEEAVHSWIQYYHIDGDRLVTTPTLRQLLSYEIETSIQPASRLPLLKEKSAGMGLLWVRRQLAYQTQIFDNVLNMGSKYDSMKEAVGAAYSQVYDPYHGWAVQKIFSYSFQAAPEAEAILRHMNPHRLRELLGEPAEYDRTPEEDDNHPLGQLIHHLGSEWDKLASHVVQVFQPPNNDRDDEDARTPTDAPAVDDAYITEQMVLDAHTQIQKYLHIVRPMLHHLSDLFAALNMDDPTRV